MTPVEQILAKLPDAKQSGKGWSARCPAHVDERASLSIGEGADGRALVKCHAGCEVDAICVAVGMEQADLFNSSTTSASSKPRPHRKKQGLCGHDNVNSADTTFATAEDAVAALERRHGPPSNLWTYFDAGGEPAGGVVRWNLADGTKDFRPIARHADGWRISGMPEPRPLYGLPELAKANRVYIVEGEKAADAARSIGLVATTSPHGSKSAGMADWSPLAGKDCVILPDNDDPGHTYAGDVAAILAKLRPESKVSIVVLTALPDESPMPKGGDLVDWIDAHGDAAEPEVMAAKLIKLADAAEPIEAAFPAALSERFVPFPVDALPDPVGGFVTASAKAIGCDPSYVAVPMLTAMAAAIGNSRRIQLKRGWTAPPVLWCAIVGESGTSKTPAFKLAMRPFRDRQRKAIARLAEEMNQYQIDLAHFERAMADWKRKNRTDPPPEAPVLPQGERCIVSDTTVEALAPILLRNPRGLLLACDELAGWIGSFDRYAKGKGGADSSHWLSMFAGDCLIVDRKTGDQRTIYVPQALMSICGGIQPAILHRALGSEHWESGLAARILLACPPRKAKRWTEADIDPNATAEIAALVERLYELQPTLSTDDEWQPVVVGLTAEAKAAWTAYYNAHAVEQADLTGDLAAAWSKLEEYAARLALVIHFIRWAADDPTLMSADVVDVMSMEAGIRLVTWFKREARRVYAMLGETAEDSELRRLAEWIGRKGGSVTAREVQMGCRWLQESGAAEAALNEFVRRKWGDWQPSPPGQPGRPTRRFRLATLSTVNGISPSPRERSNNVDVDAVDTPETQPDGEWGEL